MIVIVVQSKFTSTLFLFRSSPLSFGSRQSINANIYLMDVCFRFCKNLHYRLITKVTIDLIKDNHSQYIQTGNQ